MASLKALSVAVPDAAGLDLHRERSAAPSSGCATAWRNSRSRRCAPDGAARPRRRVPEPPSTWRRWSASIIRWPREPEPIARATLEPYVQLVLTDRTPLTQNFSGGIVGHHIWRFADLSTRLEFLLAGFGWCNMPLHMVRDHIAAGRLKSAGARRARPVPVPGPRDADARQRDRPRRAMADRRPEAAPRRLSGGVSRPAGGRIARDSWVRAANGASLLSAGRAAFLEYLTFRRAEPEPFVQFESMQPRLHSPMFRVRPSASRPEPARGPAWTEKGPPPCSAFVAMGDALNVREDALWPVARGVRRGRNSRAARHVIAQTKDRIDELVMSSLLE